MKIDREPTSVIRVPNVVHENPSPDVGLYSESKRTVSGGKHGRFANNVSRWENIRRGKVGGVRWGAMMAFYNLFPVVFSGRYRFATAEKSVRGVRFNRVRGPRSGVWVYLFPTIP